MTIGSAAPENYQQQLDDKVSLTQTEFTDFYQGELDVFPSAPSHFRMRAEFKMWHEGDDTYYIMYEPGEYKTPIRITNFSIGSHRINELMPSLIEAIKKLPSLRQKLFQIEFLTTTKGEALVTLIYHKPLKDDWIEAASQLEIILNCKIIGRSKKQKIVLTRDFVTEEIHLINGQFKYQQVEASFTQPNAGICNAMLSWAIEKTTKNGGDLLELYCGNGNFTIPLSKNFDRVLATEVSKTSIKSAQYNIQLNNCSNIDVLRMSSEEFTEAMNKEREFRRLKELDLESYKFSTILVDPPRAGLDEGTEKLCGQFDNILYISCNPETLKENLKTLCQTHKIDAMALFDQFPYTHHRECGVALSRRR